MPLANEEAARLFEATLLPHRAFCMTGIVVMGAMVLLAPSSALPAGTVIQFMLEVFIVCEMVRKVPDVSRAIALFGCGWLAATIVGCSLFLIGNIKYQLCRNVPSPAVGVLSALTSLVPIYLRLSGTSPLLQTVNNLTVGLTFWLSPRWSQLPHDTTTLIMWSGLLLGDLLGMLAQMRLVPTQKKEKAVDASVAYITDPLSLCFNDSRCEAAYVASISESSQPTVQPFCLTLGALALFRAIMSNGSPTPWLEAAAYVLYYLALWRVSSNRRSSSMALEADLEQRHRRRLKLRVLLFAVLLLITFGARECAFSTYAMTEVPHVLLLALHVPLEWVICVPPLHRKLNKCLHLMYVVLSHVDWHSSSLVDGALLHFMLHFCCLAFGQLVGYSIDSVRRDAYVKEQDAMRRMKRAVSVAKELEHQKHLAQVQQLADSRLNHVIKGRCGTASSLVGSVLSSHAHLLPKASQELLLRSIECLQQAAEWCHRREVFVQLEQNSYASQRIASDIPAILSHALGGHGTVECEPPDMLVLVDVLVLRVALEESISNALKYRERNTPLSIRATLSDDKTELLVDVVNQTSSHATVLSKEQLTRVGKPGFRAHVASVMSDGLGLDSLTVACNGAGGDAELHMDRQVTQLTIRLPVDEMPEAEPTPQPQSESASSENTSDLVEHSQPRLICVGLDDDELAREVQHALFRTHLHADMTRSGTIGATLEDKDCFVDVALGALDVNLMPLKGACRHADVVILDNFLHSQDTETQGWTIARQLRERNFGGVICLLTACGPKALANLKERNVGVDCILAKGQALSTMATQILQAVKERQQSCSLDTPLTLDTGHSEETSTQHGALRPLRCLGIDDDCMSRLVQETFFKDKLNANMKYSRSIGETLEEQQAFVDVVMGLRDADTLLPLEAKNHLPDLVLLDQNINIRPHITGTSIAKQLHERRFSGCVCILAGASLHEVEGLRSSPGVDLGFVKGTSLEDMRDKILDHPKLSQWRAQFAVKRKS
ncbi:hypothetical protein AB1Y20_008510 [Prymnesium parvum]|uniref:Response regulatory domain-containing protein n=1 Tax=Prymnesium parvum TaxID=97485 RepID=A0AB34IRC3_PRYPA